MLGTYFLSLKDYSLKEDAPTASVWLHCGRTASHGERGMTEFSGLRYGTDQPGGGTGLTKRDIPRNELSCRRGLILELQ